MIISDSCPHNIVDKGVCVNCSKVVPEKKPDKPNLGQAFKGSNPVLGV